MQRLQTSGRVQKLLAAEGIGSRRSIEELIRRRRVQVNGRTAELGDRVGIADKIYVDGRRVRIRGIFTPRMIAYHKPCGELVTRTRGSHQIVFDHLPPLEHGRWVAVGRLDINTSGLLLLCNDGELAHRLAHPSYRQARIYRVRVMGEVTDSMVRNLLEGVILNGKIARFESIEEKGDSGGINRWFEVTIREGRHREVRRLWQSQQTEVSRLIRIGFAGVSLDMPVGTWRELVEEDAVRLYRKVGLG